MTTEQQIPERRLGFHFSSSQDGSANDYTIYVYGDLNEVSLGARYKNSDQNGIYEMIMNSNDLVILANLLMALSEQMQDNERPVVEA